VVACKDAIVSAKSDPAERKPELLQIARIYEQELQQPALGFLTLARVFAEVPGTTRIHPGHGPWGVTLAEAEPWARMFM